MAKFHSTLKAFLELKLEVILVQVVKTQGSTPRDSGALMLVNKSTFFGTIGGGRLEYEALNKARDYLDDFKFTKSLYNYSLGSVFGQCCGGGVSLSFEKLSTERAHELQKEEFLNANSLGDVLIFGGGHVGKALVKQLEPIPLNVNVIDSRPQKTLDFLLPEGCKVTAFPEAEIRHALAGSAYVILTHDHALDFLLVKEALAKNNAAYIGMIGSKTKGAVLKKWLEKEKIFTFEKVFTPLGASITGLEESDKRPEVIASLVISEILISLQIHKKKCLPEVQDKGFFDENSSPR